MNKSYRWIVAGVFLILSLFMVKRPVSFPSFTFEVEPSFQNISVEEREIVHSVLSRLEKRKNLFPTISKIESAISKETVELFVSQSSTEDKIAMKEGLGIVFPKKFFESDPIDQEFAMSQMLNDIAQVDLGNESYLAKIPSKKR